MMTQGQLSSCCAEDHMGAKGWQVASSRRMLRVLLSLTVVDRLLCQRVPVAVAGQATALLQPETGCARAGEQPTCS